MGRRRADRDSQQDLAQTARSGVTFWRSAPPRPVWQYRNRGFAIIRDAASMTLYRVDSGAAPMDASITKLIAIAAPSQSAMSQPHFMVHALMRSNVSDGPSEAEFVSVRIENVEVPLPP